MKIKNDKLFIQITCLIAAIVLWMTVMLVTNQTLEETYKNIPVTIKNLSTLENSNLVMMQDKENITVTVKATGLTEQLSNISSRDFSASIDVLGFKEGISNAKVEVVGPSGVDIVSISPSQIACKIEGVISKVMEVEVQPEGNQSNFYYRGQAVPNPSYVKITGPRSVVNSAHAAVATINIDGAKDTVVKTVPVRVYDDMDTEIFFSVPTGNVEVSVPIYPTKYVPLKANVIGLPEEGYEVVNVTVKPERVRIAGQQDVLDTVKELYLEDLDITGSYNNILSSKNILNTEGLILLDLETSPVVNVLVEKIIEKEFAYTLNDIQFINKRADKDLVLEEGAEEIRVVVTGTWTLINSLKKSDIILTADLSEAGIGLNTVKLDYVSETSFKNIAFSLDTINVELVEAESSQAGEEE